VARRGLHPRSEPFRNGANAQPRASGTESWIVHLTHGILGRSIHARLVTAFLAVVAIMTGVAAFNLIQIAALHQRLADVATRDLNPLAELRQVDDAFQSFTVHGLVLALSADAKMAALQKQHIEESRAAVEDAVVDLLQDTPAELQHYATAVRDDWAAFTTADAAYRASRATGGTDLGRLGGVADAAYLRLAVDTKVMAEALVADAAGQRREVERSYREAKVWTAVLLAGGVSLAIFLGYAIARSIVRPLTEVKRAMQALAAGDLKRRARVRSRDEVGEMAQAVNDANDVIRANVQKLEEAQSQLLYQANHDSLTGLANRALFEQRTREVLAAGRPATVLLVDLDDFKPVNDRFGHAVGDRLLVGVGERLRGALRSGDVAARLGGDEFVVLLCDVPDGTSDSILERVAAAFETPVPAGIHEVRVQCSSGQADSWRGAGFEELLRRADVAMYAAKNSGKGRGVRYHADLEPRLSPSQGSRSMPTA
jgi:diguanylate cyclase (GGDEF)-like protein